jgi:hypothetical protein
VVDPHCLSITGVSSKSDIVPCFCVFCLLSIDDCRFVLRPCVEPCNYLSSLSKVVSSFV